MIPVFLKMPFLDMASTVWAMPEEQWIDDSPTLKDTELLLKEAKGESQIDDNNLREQMIQQWKSEKVSLFVKELPGRTRLVFLGTVEQWNEIPWTLWSRIMQAIQEPVKHILFYAHPLKREFPNGTSSIGASNINAGYSYLCQKSLVVIYRFEEATRVLLHELLHTACFDNGKDTEDLEASTEAWTEILLCALLSKGSVKKFNQLWLKQCEWIVGQTALLQKSYNVNTRNDYAWRYTLGKHLKLIEMGFMVKCKPYANPGLRFTTPEWNLQ